jgi:SAM-dependent methyltransferase
MSVRALSVAESKGLAAGADHYRAYVGPPGRYDSIGASQFALLFLLGLREEHRLLDFGCGSLRLGRLAIPYLLSDRYFGVDPAQWLVEEGFARELGLDARDLKSPRFDFNADYRADMFGVSFDFIIAQSVFSHTGHAAAVRALGNLGAVLAPGGLIVANFLVDREDAHARPDDHDWFYPGVLRFEAERIERVVREAGLAFRVCPWPHPSLTWYLIARDAADLPAEDELARFAIAPRVHAAAG